MISIIIPFYNRSHTLDEAVQSVLAQTVTDYELILVNDASTEPVRAEKYDDPRIKIFHHKINKGAAAARNTGIQAAQSDYIAFLDSDDIWRPEKLERQLHYMNQGNRAVCCTSFELVKPNGRTVHRHLSENTNWHREFLCGCRVSPGSTMIARKTVFETVGLLDETLRRFEDWDWLLRLERHYDFHVLDEVLTQVRLGGYAAPEIVEGAADAIVRKHGPQLKKTTGGDDRILRASAVLEKAYAHFRAGQGGQAVGYVLKSLFISPLRFGLFLKRAGQKLWREILFPGP